jgi:hypothetical protein
MKRVRKDTIRKLYREAILQTFGCGDKKLDRSLISALNEDVHLAGKGPGQWVSKEGVLEIYCENGIPNATDIHEFPPMPEFGIVRGSCTYNSELWCKIDKYVNLGLKAMGRYEKVYHEPFNGGVVGVYWG